MKIDDRIKMAIMKEEYIPNNLMPLDEKNTSSLLCNELNTKRGYTLRTEPSDIRELYDKQKSLNILNVRR